MHNLPYVLLVSIFAIFMIYGIHNYQSYVNECTNKGGIVIKVGHDNQCVKMSSIEIINMDKSDD